MTHTYTVEELFPKKESCTCTACVKGQEFYKGQSSSTENKNNKTVKNKNGLKDSGNRQTYSTGAQKESLDPEKGRFDLIPPGPMFALAKIYAAGAIKYNDRNWQKGIKISRLLDSTKRHLTQFELGMEDECHLYQFIWNAIALAYTMDSIKDGLLPKELLDIPCYMPANVENKDEWRKENRLVEGYSVDKTFDMEKKVAKNKKNIGLIENEDEALGLAIDSLEKQFGKGIIITGDSDKFPEIERIKSGSIGLDKAMSGGYARGRIIELSGLESAGKTSISLHAIAECQKQNNKCAFIDAEHSLDINYAASLGVDVENLLISQPESGEQALNVAEMLIKSGAVSLIVVDSVAALTPRAEIDGKIGDSHIGLQARLMSQAMRMLAGPALRANTSIIFTNQIREKMNVTWGSNETTSGGRALRFYASQRLDIRRIQTLTQGEEKVGIRTRVKVAKSKVGPPFKQAEFNIMFGKGIDWAAELLDLSVSLGIVDKAGAWYSYKGERLGQGAANTAKTIEEKIELAEELRSKVLE